MPGIPMHSFADNSLDPPVRGFLHPPDAPNSHALILAHGAGSNSQAPLLVAFAETFAGAGYTVLRCDLPFRQSRPYGPPGPGDADMSAPLFPAPGHAGAGHSCANCDGTISPGTPGSPVTDLGRTIPPRSVPLPSAR